MVAIAITAGLGVSVAGYDSSANATPPGYTIKVTDLTSGQLLAPVIAATQKPGAFIFTLGQAADPALAHLAIYGDPSQLKAELVANSDYGDVEINSSPAGPTNPGSTASVTLAAKGGFSRVTVAAMLVPTNDVFMAIQNVPLPTASGESVTYYANAYEAGAAQVTESCDNIAPVPSGFQDTPCTNASFTPILLSPPSFVSVSNGIHGIADLIPSLNDWRNPVTEIVITRN
jgi:hypothetical protein